VSEPPAEAGYVGADTSRVGDAPAREAAVTLPFYRGPAGELRLIMIKRSDRGRNGGQIALPGGHREPADADLEATAVRETCEELGITADTVHIVAELPRAGPRTRYLPVRPFVARLAAVPTTWRPQESEVAAVLDVDVAQLADPVNLDEELMSFVAWPRPQVVPVRRIDGHTVWGLTLRILEPVLPKALAGEYPI
jgi:8-oxo-dGTP pyrophosphatase MutT (NUDIX family)